MNGTIIKRAALLYGITFGFALFGAAYAPEEAKIVLFNDTSFALDVSFPGREHIKVVPKERVTLGTLENVSGDITYYTYGKWLSLGALTYTVLHNEIEMVVAQAGPNIDVVITIFTNSYGLYASRVGLEKRPTGQAPIRADASRESFFPHAESALGQAAWQATGWTFEDIEKLRPHMILNLNPKASSVEVEATARRLKDEFKVASAGNQGLYNELSSIIDRAKNNMLRHSLYTPIQMAEFGRQIYRALATGDISLLGSLNQFFIAKFNKEHAEEAMVEALVLYFYYIAHKLGHVFEEGTFVIYDQSGQLYGFLDRLEKKYTRNASHFNGLAAVEGKPWLAVTGRGHRGYDVDMLAIQKKTLLFNKLDPNGTVFYLKPETHGTDNLADLIGHAGSFVYAQGRKLLPSIFGSDDVAEYSKERVPKEILTKYLVVIETLPESEEEKTRLARFAVARGVQSMYREGKRLAEKYPESAALKSFIQELEAKSASRDPKFSHLDERFGAEVILTPEEFARFGQPISSSDTF